MKGRKLNTKVDKSKVASITALTITSVLIVVFGLTFSFISILRDIHYTVMGSTLNGSVFGVVITFLGIRYFLSVKKLKKEVYKKSSRFSWGNFKSDKTRKTGNSNAEPLLTKYWMRG